jgi:hypothetical protein
MPRSQIIGAGIVGMSNRIRANGPQGGGDKLQGLPPIRNMLSPLVPFVRTRADGENRNVVFCINQLSGGVGAKRGQFGPGNRGGGGQTGGCGGPRWNGALRFVSNTDSSGVSYISAIWFKIKIGNRILYTQIDTGSIYTLVESPLNCQDQKRSSFYYGQGEVIYCDDRKNLSFLSDLTNDEITYDNFSIGTGTGVGFGPGCSSVMGLSANISQGVATLSNSTFNPTLSTSISQFQRMFHDTFKTDFRFMSFEWDEGGEGTTPGGNVCFSTGIRTPPNVSLALHPAPTTGYGYTASIKEIQFVVGDEVKKRLVEELGVLYLEVGETRNSVGTSMASFFDTGTTVPMVVLDGDVNLLSDTVGSAGMLISFTGLPFDKFRMFFKEESQPLVIEIPSALASASLMPEVTDFDNADRLLVVVGISALSQYNFSIEFADVNTASHIHFSDRPGARSEY